MRSILLREIFLAGIGPLEKISNFGATVNNTSVYFSGVVTKDSIDIGLCRDREHYLGYFGAKKVPGRSGLYTVVQTPLLCDIRIFSSTLKCNYNNNNYAEKWLQITKKESKIKFLCN